MAVIEVRDLAKSYGPAAPALQGVTLGVEKGEIYGLLGQNGAGKTTLVKILLSLVRPSAGSASILGADVAQVGVRRRVGYLPEDHRFPEYHSGESLLDFLGALSGMGSADRRRRIPEMLDRVGLRDDARRKVRAYSKGMRQRLGIAQALIHDPELVFLDEPTDGVDPVGRKQIRDLLLDLKSRGRTVFINSHLLSEVESICGRVAILSKGKLVREGSVEELTRVRNVWEIRVGGDVGLEELRREFPGVKAVEGGIEAELPDAAALNALLDRLRAKGLSITGVNERRSSLEDVFLKEVSP